MKLFTNPQDEPREAFIEAVTEEIGVRSRVNRVNAYGSLAGYNGMPWAGSFLDYAAKQSNVRLPSLTSTTSALAEFTRTGRIFRVPKRGDIVFFAFSTDDPFTQPHVGVVTDVTLFRKTGMFETIEGQTATGLPKGPQDADGVYERTRYHTDVLAFARPIYRFRTKYAAPAEDLPRFRVSQFQPGKITKATEILQLALVDAVGARDMVRGNYNAQTRSAVAAFQRLTGDLNGNGTMDDRTLKSLAAYTGYRYFRAREE